MKNKITQIVKASMAGWWYERTLEHPKCGIHSSEDSAQLQNLVVLDEIYPMTAGRLQFPVPHSASQASIDLGIKIPTLKKFQVCLNVRTVPSSNFQVHTHYLDEC